MTEAISASDLRVVFLTQWLAERQASGIAGRIIGSLGDAGMGVECMTGPPLNLDSNELPQGTKWWRRSRDEVLGVPVHRYPFYPGHSASTVERIALYGTFSASTTLLGTTRLSDTDVVLVYASPATAAAAAMAARRLFGTPYVLMIQDVWPDSVFASGFLTQGRARGLAESFTTKFVDASYRTASAITVLSPGMKSLLVERGVPQDKVAVVYNWADEDQRKTALRVPPRRMGEPLHLMYAGNLGPPQGLDVVIRALSRFPPGEVRLSLAGGGVSQTSLRRLAGASPGVDVRFLGRLDPDGLARAQETAHLHLISLRNEPLFGITLPSKTQDLLCAGAPVLSFAPGEVAAMVTDAGAGIAAKAGSEDSLEGAIRTALGWPSDHFSGLGQAGRKAYFRSMSRRTNSERLVQTIASAARSLPRSSPTSPET